MQFTTTALQIAQATSNTATVAARIARIAATVAWFVAFAAVAVTGACINATAAAREAYARETIELARNASELEAMANIPYALPPATAPVTPIVTVERFVLHALQAPATDLGPELSDEALQASWEKVAPAVGLSALTVKELKAMARDKAIAGYSRLRKAQLIEALAC